MSPALRRLVLGLSLLSVPALAAPAREDRRSARVRPVSPRPEPGELQPAEPLVAAATDAVGVDLAGFLGMVTALGATFVYARSRRLPVAQSTSRPPGRSAPVDRP